MGSLYLAILHYPVYDLQRKIVPTTVTTLDVHDTARIARTYGIAKVFIVTPLQSQHALVQRLLTHWREGAGARLKPTRKEALETIDLSYELPDVVRRVTDREGSRPRTVATHANRLGREMTAGACRVLLQKDDRPMLLLFGTGCGLARSVVDETDFSLEPIEGPTEWNHLPVRAAVAIMVDRLLGRQEEGTDESGNHYAAR
ncbi:MAG: RNA methyltransferase [Candidatus Schekmanbacteria bacterium]|nr:RNA methyltransferase [Candidatus Schekmanbacteria bacterium]